MPDITINTTTLTFTNIYYVDPVSGNDTTGQVNNASLPYKTVSAAVTAAPTNSCIYALPGTHRISKGGNASSGVGGVYDANKALTFIGVRNKTIFLCDGVTDNTDRDQHAISTKNANTQIIDIIFNVNFGTRSNNYSTAICGNNSFYVKAKVYNCVFNLTTTYAVSMIYDNDNASSVLFQNCSFIINNGKTFVGSYAGSANVTSNYSAFNTALPTDTVKTNCAANITFGPNYYTSSGSTGIYFGTYKWSRELYLIVQNGVFYTIKSSQYDTANKMYLPLQLTGGTTPTTADITTYAFDDVTTITTPTTINAETFKPIDKLYGKFELRMYKPK